MRKQTLWFLTLTDTNQVVQLQNMARGLKFRNKEAEGLYFLYSVNKGADQLRSYREADLHLCFHISKNFGFLMTQLIYSDVIFRKMSLGYS